MCLAGSWEERAIEIWEQSRSNWHWPQLPAPVLGPESSGEFPFRNYQIVVSRDWLEQDLLLENLFDHLIVHYIFCPRSLEQAGSLALSALRGLCDGDVSLARRLVNIFSDVVVDTFRLERSAEDEDKVLLGWIALAEGAGEDLSAMDRVVVGFLGRYWGVELNGCALPEVDLLQEVFAPGVRDRGIWPRQCQQMARILAPLEPGVLGEDSLRTVDGLMGNARAAPLAGLAASLEPTEYHRALQVLGLQGDLKRWYRDQGYGIEIRARGRRRISSHPSGAARWRLADPLSELDVNYSLSLSPRLIPGMTTYKRDRESCVMAGGREKIPDLLLVLDSSRSMDGHSLNTRTHCATLAAFKALQFAHGQGAEVAAINFSDRYLDQPWTRDLGRVEDVLVEYLGSRTHIPGERMLELAGERKGCLVLCITDTHIQNLYTEWDYLQEMCGQSSFVLFCIDQANRDR
ncbi:MAG: VWA domain-containing protein, partial [Methanosarcinales archaeon]|nr:VWA domain-containing protein [Methanosarcinales archaeon]